MSRLHAVAFRSEIWILQHLHRGINILVFAFDKDENKFIKLKENQLSLDNAGQDIKVLDFSCILEESTGLRQPCLLIEDNGSKTDSILRLYFLVNEKTLIKVAAFSLPSRLSCTSIMLSDGPSFSWLCRYEVHFLRNSLCHSTTHTSFKYQNDNVENLTALWSGIAKDRLLTIARTSTDSIIVVDSQDGNLPSQKFIPNIYFSIVTCINVYEENDLLLNSIQNSESQRVQVIYAGTTKGQLIRFTEGKAVAHWQLPFDDPCHIDIIKSGNGNVFAVVKSKEKMVCLINISHNKLLNKWSNQGVALVGDFLENGTNQVCLLQDNGNVDNIIRDFVLTDLNGVTIASYKENCGNQSSLSQKSQSNSECILFTVQALRTRLQASKSHLSELRMEYNDKKKLISNTCKMLCNIPDNYKRNLDITAHRKSSNLVSLIGNAYSEVIFKAKSQDGRHEQTHCGISHNVSAVWQRVIGSNWIIGVDLKHDEKRCISDISLSLLSCSNDNLYSSCYMVHDTNNPRLLTVNQESNIVLEPTPKRKKHDVCTDYSVALVTSLPLFLKEKHYTCMVALSWTDCHDNQAFLRHVTSCGSVTLDINQLVNGDCSISQKGDTRQAERDITALKAISTLTTLSLSQVPFNLIEALHQKFFVVPIGDVLALGQSETILHQANDVTGIQEGVGILVDSKRGEILIFTRHHNQIYINIHQLRDALPDDIIIDIVESVRADATWQGLRGLQNQLAIIKHHVKETFSSSQHLIVPSLGILNGIDANVRNIRNEFEVKRKRF